MQDRRQPRAHRVVPERLPGERDGEEPGDGPSPDVRGVRARGQRDRLGTRERVGPLPHHERDDGEQPPRRERPPPADDVRERCGQGGGQDAAAVERGRVQAGHPRHVPGEVPPDHHRHGDVARGDGHPDQDGADERGAEPVGGPQQRARQDGHQRRRDHPPGAQPPEQHGHERGGQREAEDRDAGEQADARGAQAEVGADVVDDRGERRDRGAQVQRVEQDRGEQQPARSGPSSRHALTTRRTARSPRAAGRPAGRGPPRRGRPAGPARRRAGPRTRRPPGPGPAGVSCTSTPRRSSGAGCRSTSPCSARRSMRLVMVPLVTSVWVSSAPGDSRYGAPARRSADSTSNSHVSRSCRANAERRARSRCRASRLTRERTVRGRTSRSGRSRSQARTIRSTSSRAPGASGGVRATMTRDYSTSREIPLRCGSASAGARAPTARSTRGSPGAPRRRSCWGCARRATTAR